MTEILSVFIRNPIFFGSQSKNCVQFSWLDKGTAKPKISDHTGSSLSYPEQDAVSWFVLCASSCFK